jgi:3'5'-cyclic nucleotide phosphodiesterase
MDVDRNRKATIVIEHLIQASDVSHTMQHWHIYRKWNERLFRELYKAYKQGRAGDPTDFWYKGEIGFFDFYIVSLSWVRGKLRCTSLMILSLHAGWLGRFLLLRSSKSVECLVFQAMNI